MKSFPFGSSQKLLRTGTQSFSKACISIVNYNDCSRKSITVAKKIIYILDHVGMVFWNGGQLLIFEATNQYGVGLFNFNDMIEKQWHTIFEKQIPVFHSCKRVAHRRLIVDRDQTFDHRIETFVRKNLNKKFSLTINKLTIQNSMNFECTQQIGEGNRTYFCSELLAKVYKTLGLLEPTKSSTQYWPGSFSDKKKLPLLKGRLSPEYTINFNES